MNLGNGAIVSTTPQAGHEQKVIGEDTDLGLRGVMLHNALPHHHEPGDDEHGQGASLGHAAIPGLIFTDSRAVERQGVERFHVGHVGPDHALWAAWPEEDEVAEPPVDL
eukprot:1433861-Alexandrium_andersonii.AAC.1